MSQESLPPEADELARLQALAEVEREATELLRWIMQAAGMKDADARAILRRAATPATDRLVQSGQHVRYVTP